MNPLYFCLLIAMLSTLHLSCIWPIILWLLDYAQPFALEYYKDWLTNRRK